MSQIAFERLTDEWVTLSSLITVENDKTYYIQNRGASVLIACESDSEPSDDDGVLILPYKTLEYKVGDQDLYLKSFTGTCSINISDEMGSGGGGGNKKKYGVDIDAIIGGYTDQGMLILPMEKQDLVLTGVKSIGAQALKYKFYNTCITSFIAPDLENIVTGSACEGCFYGGSIATASMPKLTSIGNYHSCYQMFRGCPMEEVTIAAVDIKGSHCCEAMFERCIKLKNIYFPNLVDVSGQTTQFYNMLVDCSGVTVHFKSSMQSTMEGWQDVIDGFGGTNTTVLFDL